MAWWILSNAARIVSLCSGSLVFLLAAARSTSNSIAGIPLSRSQVRLCCSSEDCQTTKCYSVLQPCLRRRRARHFRDLCGHMGGRGPSRSCARPTLDQISCFLDCCTWVRMPRRSTHHGFSAPWSCTVRHMEIEVSSRCHIRSGAGPPLGPSCSTSPMTLRKFNCIGLRTPSSCEPRKNKIQRPHCRPPHRSKVVQFTTCREQLHDLSCCVCRSVEEK